MSAFLPLVLFLRGDFRGAVEAVAGSSIVHFYATVPQTLEAYLDAVKIPRWHQKLMFDLRIVRVRRRAGMRRTSARSRVAGALPSP